MITELTMTAFRKVEQSAMTFTEGLNVIRGANEASKSTRLEAIFYCLFGSKALSNTLDEVVTWGRPVKDLRVELVLQLEDKFRFVRAKSGAEVYKNGGCEPFVTGQAECSAFAAQLLGADLNAALNLMVATQGNLRGALDGGPKATSEMIESLSDLDVIEQILDKAQATWQLGSTAVLVERLAGAEAVLANTSVPVAPDEAAHAAAVADAEATIAKGVVEVAKLLAERDALCAAYTAEEAKQKRGAELGTEIGRLTIELSNVEAQIEDTRKGVEVQVEDPAPLEEEIRGADQAVAMRAAWVRFDALPKFSSSAVRAEHKAAVAEANAKARDLQTRYNTAQSEIKFLKSQQITSDTCPSCGQDISKLPHIAEKKSEIEHSLQAQEKIILSLQMQDEANDRILAVLKALTDADDTLRAAARGLGGYVELDESTIPATPKWIGPSASSEVCDIAALRTRVAAIKAAIKARDMAQGRLDTLQAQAKRVTASLAKAFEERKALVAMSVGDFADLSRRFSDAHEKHTNVVLAIETLRSNLDSHKQAFAAEVAAWKDAESKLAGAKAAVAQLMADIREIEANNVLVKKVRAARPIIASKLWGLVLNTVSTMFSRMRGELSVVTREKDGFYVNGKPAFGGGLSGSAKDILGLAIRAALVKTFLPNCPFLIVDEPAQGCDAERAASLTGFIASCGFAQSVMITHSDVSEMGAANLIQL